MPSNSSTPPDVKSQPRASNQTLEFTWSPTVGATGYLLELYTDSSYTTLARSVSLGSTERYTKVTGLTNGTLYYSLLKQSFDNGSTYSDPAFFRPFAPGSSVPGIPSKANATLDGNSIIVSWEPPVTQPDSPIYWYVIISSSNNPSDPVIYLGAEGTDRSIRITEINSQSNYTFKVFAVNCPGYSTATLTPQIQSGTITWTSHPPLGYCLHIASSLDGTKLATIDHSNGYIYTSTDSGATWTEQTNSGKRRWYSIASSADGNKLAAVVLNGYIYTSTDSGVTWTERTSVGQVRAWNGIASSADGTKLVAVDSNNGFIYTSTNSGVTWTQQVNAGNRNWKGIASSADGTKLVAGDYNNGYIYTSIDSGLNWTQQIGAGQRNWTSIASSADGTKIVTADARNGYIYISYDSGMTWIPQIPTPGKSDWHSITTSGNGTKFVAVGYYINVWTGTLV